MSKRKTNKPKVHCNIEACNTQAKPRRSIPVAEVNQIVEHAVREVKSQRTIYDDRIQILNQLESIEDEVEYHEGVLHRLRLQSKTLRSDLAQTNLAIKRQLELDGE